MSFVEFRFLWFFLLVFIVYWAMRNNAARKVWLLLCSYVFYAAWNWKFTFLAPRVNDGGLHRRPNAWTH